MNYRQFKNVLGQFCLKYQVLRSQAYVSHGGAMLIYGYRHETEDVDVAVPKEIWDRLAAQLEVTIVHNPTTQLIKIPGMEVDVHLHDDTRSNGYHMVDDVLITTVQQTLDDKLKLNRLKDMSDIEILRRVLGHNADDVEAYDSHDYPYTYEEVWELEHDLWFDSYHDALDNLERDDDGNFIDKHAAADIADEFRLTKPAKYFI